MNNILDKLEEIKVEYEEQVSKVKDNHNIAKERILEEYKEEKAKEQLKQLRSDSTNDMTELFDKYISKSQDEIERAENTIVDTDNKEVNEVERANKLMELSLVKDNPKAILKQVERNKDDEYILDLIKDMTSTLKDNEKIVGAIDKIESNYIENVIAQAKQNITIEQSLKSNHVNIFKDTDTSHYELGNSSINTHQL